MKGRELISLPVVSSDNNKLLGEVKDIIYDPSKNRILGYVVEKKGWLREGRGFLHSELVRHEKDCLVVKDESVVGNVGRIPELKEAIDTQKDIRGWRVEYNDGRYIGIIQDLVVDAESGEISGYEISDGIVQDLLVGRVTIPNTGICINNDRVIAIKGIESKF